MLCYKKLVAPIYSIISYLLGIFKQLPQKFKGHLEYLQYYPSISLAISYFKTDCLI